MSERMTDEEIEAIRNGLANWQKSLDKCGSWDTCEHAARYGILCGTKLLAEVAAMKAELAEVRKA